MIIDWDAIYDTDHVLCKYTSYALDNYQSSIPVIRISMVQLSQKMAPCSKIFQTNKAYKHELIMNTYIYNRMQEQAF